MISGVSRGAVGVTTLLEDEAVEGVSWPNETIVFSACNEDSRSELRAFGSLQGKRVACVTAGGGRVLNLIAGRPSEIWAIDLNPAQNALLELKLAGLRELDHEPYLAFLGVRESTDRLATYESRLRGHLSKGAQRFFDERPALVSGGPLLQGKLERFFTRLAVVLRLAHPRGLERLFAFDDLEEQRRYLSRFDTFLWRTVAENVARRSFMRLFSGDPGFYRYVPEHIPLHRKIYERVHGYFHNHLARDNSLLQLVFFGRYVFEPALPIYLNAETFADVKAALDEVSVHTVTAGVDEALVHAGPEAFDAFSLSDISSYLDDSAHARLFAEVVRSARPGARLCSRSNLYHRPLPQAVARRVRRDLELERDLAVHDHSCVHEFVVGEIE